MHSLIAIQRQKGTEGQCDCSGLEEDYGAPEWTKFKMTLHRGPSVFVVVWSLVSRD